MFGIAIGAGCESLQVEAAVSRSCCFSWGDGRKPLVKKPPTSLQRTPSKLQRIKKQRRSGIDLAGSLTKWPMYVLQQCERVPKIADTSGLVVTSMSTSKNTIDERQDAAFHDSASIARPYFRSFKLWSSPLDWKLYAVRVQWGERSFAGYSTACKAAAGRQIQGLCKPKGGLCQCPRLQPPAGNEPVRGRPASVEPGSSLARNCLLLLGSRKGRTRAHKGKLPVCLHPWMLASTGNVSTGCSLSQDLAGPEPWSKQGMLPSAGEEANLMEKGPMRM